MIKVLELFGGIGACSNALKRLNIDFVLLCMAVYGIVEWKTNK